MRVSQRLEEPRICRSVHLNFMGDWGQANFHRICSWLCQEMCDRAGPRSRVGIWNTVGGGLDAPLEVFDGSMDLCLATPAALIGGAMTGRGIFRGRQLHTLRALAVLPQTDRMVFAIDPKFGVNTFEDLRRVQPPIQIATSPDDGTSMIGYVAARFMEAHGIDAAVLASWGGGYLTAPRPDQALARMERGEADAVLQEAIMTPWWQTMMRVRQAVALPAEAGALRQLQTQLGLSSALLPADYLPGCSDPLPALDFSDFVVIVREDMAVDVAHLLTWCLVETRDAIERQFRHIPAERSPLSYPLEPARMARPPLPLHPGAEHYYREAGLLDKIPAELRCNL
jgi:TRAP-type uncharacterized transport system substrate-binding protein